MHKFNTPKKKKMGEVTEIYLFLQNGDNKSQEKGGKRERGSHKPTSCLCSPSSFPKKLWNRAPPKATGTHPGAFLTTKNQAEERSGLNPGQSRRLNQRGIWR